MSRLGRPIAARGLGVTPGSDLDTPRPGGRSRSRDEERGAPPEVPRLGAESLNPFGGRGKRFRFLKGKGSILERQLRSRSQSTRPSSRKLRPGRTPAPIWIPPLLSVRQGPHGSCSRGGLHGLPPRCCLAGSSQAQDRLGTRNQAPPPPSPGRKGWKTKMRDTLNLLPPTGPGALGRACPARPGGARGSQRGWAANRPTD